MDDLLGLSLDTSETPAGSRRPPRPPPMGNGNTFDALTRGQPASRPLTPQAKPPSAALATAPSAAPAARQSNGDAFASLFASSTVTAAPKQPASNSSLPMAARQQADAQPAAPTAVPVADPFNFSGLDDDVFGLSSAPTTAPAQVHSGVDHDDDILGLLGKPTDEVLRQCKVEEEAKAQAESEQRVGHAKSDAITQSSRRAREGEDDDGWGGFGLAPRERTSLDSVQSMDDHLDVGVASARAGKGKGKGSSYEPPPHIIGQLVEMGFDPLEAREALIRTSGDMQGAIDSMVGGTGPHPTAGSDVAFRNEKGRTMTDEFAAWQARQAHPPSRPSPHHAHDTEEPEWAQIQHQLVEQASQLGTAAFARATSFWSSAKASVAKALDEHPQRSNEEGPAWARPPRNEHPPAAATSPSSHQFERPEPRFAEHERGAAPTSDWTVRAAEAARTWQRKLAAAHGVAPKAGNPPDGRPKWMTSGADAGKAPAPDVPSDGRPKWMASSFIPAPASAPPSSAPNPGATFHDDADAPHKPAAQRTQQHSGPTAAGPISPPNATIGTASTRLKVAEDTSAYVSPARRRRTPGSTPTASNAPTPAPRPTQPAQRSARDITPDAIGAVDKWRQAKRMGNDAFGRGAYGDAEQAYTRALSTLGERSLRRVVVLNNRAACRLHNGDAPGALADTQAVLRLIAGGAPNPPAGVTSIDTLITPQAWSPAEEAPLPSDLADDVPLNDAWGKALMRYAQAAEAAERYVSARKAWLALQKYERAHGAGSGAAMRSRSATEGLARCDKAMRPTAQKPVQASKPAAISARDAASVRAAGERASAAARVKFREAAQAKEGEDAQRLALKDGVDAKLTVWKAGKETNIRALLGSVDTVVGHTPFAPPKVGMHQLVTDAQVKKAYMKTISRLHPDKLATSTELEHRMLAAGAFAALNDAWVGHTN